VVTAIDYDIPLPLFRGGGLGEGVPGIKNDAHLRTIATGGATPPPYPPPLKRGRGFKFDGSFEERIK